MELNGDHSAIPCHAGLKWFGNNCKAHSGYAKGDMRLEKHEKHMLL